MNLLTVQCYLTHVANEKRWTELPYATVTICGINRESLHVPVISLLKVTHITRASCSGRAVCGHSLAGTADSNSARGMDVCLL
jgi:hypothetical protein